LDYIGSNSTHLQVILGWPHLDDIKKSEVSPIKFQPHLTAFLYDLAFIAHPLELLYVFIYFNVHKSILFTFLSVYLPFLGCTINPFGTGYLVESWSMNIFNFHSTLYTSQHFLVFVPRDSRYSLLKTTDSDHCSREEFGHYLVMPFGLLARLVDITIY
jgi:hypothetical protein